MTLLVGRFRVTDIVPMPRSMFPLLHFDSPSLSMSISLKVSSNGDSFPNGESNTQSLSQSQKV